MVLALGMALLIGLALGSLGGGGAILTVPVLVYALGYAARPAVAASLLVVGLTSLVGALVHWRLGNVRLPAAALFGALAMGGAFAGARLSVFMSGAGQLVLLAFVMVAAGVSMLRRRHDQNEDGLPRTTPGLAMLAPVALAVGVLTGLVGVGGGFLVVPALVVLARIPLREAIGTSLAVIALNSAAGFAGYLGTVSVDWGFLTGFAATAIVGALAGAALTRVVPVAALRQSFAMLLLGGGGLLLYTNVPALGAPGLWVTPRGPTTMITR